MTAEHGLGIIRVRSTMAESTACQASRMASSGSNEDTLPLQPLEGRLGSSPGGSIILEFSQERLHACEASVEDLLSHA